MDVGTVRGTSMLEIAKRQDGADKVMHSRQYVRDAPVLLGEWEFEIVSMKLQLRHIYT